MSNDKSAWEAIDRGDFAAAAQIWEGLIHSSRSDDEIESLKHGYGYALVGLKRWVEARAVYQHLYEQTGSHTYLHQMGMVEREAGNYDRAAAFFRQEHALLGNQDNLVLAANFYEQSLVEYHLGHTETSIALARRCYKLSMSTDDRVMHGCAHRLLGDLACNEAIDKAHKHFLDARQAFEEAKDEVAIREIDERIRQIT